MKLVPLLVALAVLLLCAATIWIGSRVREEPVVTHPYEAGQALVRRGAEAAAAGGHDHDHARAGRPPDLAPGCDLGAGPCGATLDGGAELWLELSPRPLRAMSQLAVEARLSRGGRPVEGAELQVSFAMSGMSMGDNTARLAEAGGGRYLGSAVLVRCQSGRRDWRATAIVRLAGREVRAALPLRLGE